MLHIALTRIAQEIFAHLRRACKRNHVHIVVKTKRAPRSFTKARNHIEDAIWYTGLRGQLRNAQSSEG